MLNGSGHVRATTLYEHEIKALLRYLTAPDVPVLGIAAKQGSYADLHHDREAIPDGFL
jgi:hypothetical protein